MNKKAKNSDKWMENQNQISIECNDWYDCNGKGEYEWERCMSAGTDLWLYERFVNVFGLFEADDGKPVCPLAHHLHHCHLPVLLVLVEQTIF